MPHATIADGVVTSAARRRILIFDTTLRDGEQSPGCTMTTSQKIAVAEQLARLGVDVIEAGFPAASSGEQRAVAAIAPRIPAPVVLCGLARASNADIATCARALEKAARPRIHTFLATSDLHMRQKLRMERGEVVARVHDAVSYARTLVDDVEFSPEDASRSDAQFLLEVLRVALEAGATTINIPDTVGYATPDEYGELVRRVCALAADLPDVVVSTHCHDDLGLAVANSLAGVRAGARQVECTVNGIGERAGNASLEEVVMALATRADYFDAATSVDTREIVRTSRLVSDCTGVLVPPNKAVVGANAFAHEAGIHQDGVLKARETYEIMDPTAVGCSGSSLVLGKHSGRNAVRQRLSDLGVHIDDDAFGALFERFKALADREKRVDDAKLVELAKVEHQSQRRDRTRSSRGSATRPGHKPRTLFDKVWDAHVVRPSTASTPAVLYVDLHLVHEVTSAQAFAELRARTLSVRRPSSTIATMDHSTPTNHGALGGGRRALATLPFTDAAARAQLERLEENCAEFGIPLYALGDERQGIVHVIGPELGLTQPGMTVVCGDSHTSTHGAFGALAFGIGTSQVAHVLATQCLLQERPKRLEVRVDGALPPGVSAKDIILAIIARLGVGGGTGHVIEYRGTTISALSMEERMTVCNMSIEAGARAGMIAPDDTTFEYLAGRPHAPHDATWDAALTRWRTLRTDDDATFDAGVVLDATSLAPMITYGTNPGTAVPITGRVPEPDRLPASDRDATRQALAYMGLTPGQPLLGTPVSVVFLGSCTNSRLSDLRAAANVLRNRRVAPGVRMLVVPGSQSVKRAAEAERLDRVFIDAGAEWRDAGCSMCIAMNGDTLRPGQVAVSTSNRNFEGRQGAGGRTLLASPITAAASAIAGVVADPRTMLTESVI